MNANVLPKHLEQGLQDFTQRLVTNLSANLYACILYGSAVRGDFAAQSSDINVLIILNESTPAAHDVIADAISVNDIRIDPLIIGRAGMKRNFEMFGSKFLSISRDFRILYGSDPFKGFDIDKKILRFLAEQSLRELRMRAIRAYVLYSRDRLQYVRFINRMRSSIFIGLSDIVRLTNETDVPFDFSSRVKTIEAFFTTDASVLNDFLQLSGRQSLSPQEIQSLHLGLTNLLNHAVMWVESQWNVMV